VVGNSVTVDVADGTGLEYELRGVGLDRMME
jgi:hypothetical protein